MQPVNYRSSASPEYLTAGVKAKIAGLCVFVIATSLTSYIGFPTTISHRLGLGAIAGLVTYLYQQKVAQTPVIKSPSAATLPASIVEKSAVEDKVHDLKPIASTSSINAQFEWDVKKIHDESNVKLENIIAQSKINADEILRKHEEYIKTLFENM